MPMCFVHCKIAFAVLFRVYVFSVLNYQKTFPCHPSKVDFWNQTLAHPDECSGEQKSPKRQSEHYTDLQLPVKQVGRYAEIRTSNHLLGIKIDGKYTYSTCSNHLILCYNFP